ncbi:MAG: ribosomal protection-like ABC-F family protein [Campylobacterales bacterium]
MALIDINGLKKSFEAQKILDGVDFVLEKGERVSLLGKNGSGKSTLLKIIMGEMDSDDGKIIRQNGVEIKMLAQDPRFDAEDNVIESLKKSLSELFDALKEFENVNERLAQNHDDKELLKRSEELTLFLDHHSAWNLEDKIERIVRQLKLDEFRSQRTVTLSGGEQRRVALASLLLQKPDILLLDEPTNHLDVYMVEFLEELILSEGYTMIFISHDRYFIDRIATRCIEIDDAKLRSFRGGYANYLSGKAQLLENMRTEHENLLRLLKQEENWYQRGVSARRKRNEGRKRKLLDLRDQAKKNPSAIRKMRVELEREKKNWNGGSAQNRQKELFWLENVSLSLGGKEIIRDFTARILQKDRIAIVGPNGSGKSTLLRLLRGELRQDKGSVRVGDFVSGYFDQSKASLDDSKDILETFCPNGGDRVEVQGRNMHVFGYLKNFLFPKEFLDKKVGILSGGEKSRVALALLFAKKVDCLILDEPTNDLDIPTINILEEYIQNFEGCVIFVSHDRYFVDKLANKLLIFEGNGRIEESYQGYSEYLEIERELRELGDMESAASAPESKPKDEKPKKESKKLSYKEKLEYESLPKEIEALEAEIKRLTNALGDPEIYQKEGISKLSVELEEAEAALEAKMERFFEIEEKIEGFEG